MKFLFLGDLFYNYDYVSKDIEEISKDLNCKDHYVIVNLEGPITKSCERIKKRGEHLKQSPVIVEVLKKLNVKCVTLANNHIMDYGYQGLLDTLNILQENNIQYIGAGRNIEEATKPLIINCEDHKIIIYNSGWNVEETIYATEDSPGCAPYDRKRFLSSGYSLMQTHKTFVIYINHCGFEYNLFPMPRDINISHQLVDSGADLVINHHPHVIQPVEKYKNKYIFYSIGNFYFSSFRSEFSCVKDIKYNEIIGNTGLAISCCIEKNNIDTSFFFVQYNPLTEKSQISREIPQLFNIINRDFSLKREQSRRNYIRLCKQHRNNFTPVLLENDIYARIQILFLHTLYSIYNNVRKINIILNKIKDYIK